MGDTAQKKRYDVRGAPHILFWLGEQLGRRKTNTARGDTAQSLKMWEHLGWRHLTTLKEQEVGCPLAGGATVYLGGATAYLVRLG